MSVLSPLNMVLISVARSSSVVALADAASVVATGIVVLLVVLLIVLRFQGQSDATGRRRAH